MSGANSQYGKLQLGSFVFDDVSLETPEQLDGVTDETLIATTVFPGGSITQKTFGKVPTQISWRGQFSGTNALDRVAALRSIKPNVDGTKTSLIFLDRLWTGQIAKIDFIFRHQFLVHYHCFFDPDFDGSSAGVLSALDAQAQASALASKLSLHIQSLQALIGALASGDFDAGLLISAYAPSLLGPVGSLLSTTVAALGTAKGVISDITTEDQATITSNALAVLNTATPLAASTNPNVSSAANDVINHTNNIVGILNTLPSAIATLSIVNPNLLKLAAVYYGDQSKWTLIASANNISDPQPGGQFDALVIPELT